MHKSFSKEHLLLLSPRTEFGGVWLLGNAYRRVGRVHRYNRSSLRDNFIGFSLSELHSNPKMFINVTSNNPQRVHPGLVEVTTTTVFASSQAVISSNPFHITSTHPWFNREALRTWKIIKLCLFFLEIKYTVRFFFSPCRLWMSWVKTLEIRLLLC